MVSPTGSSPDGNIDVTTSKIRSQPTKNFEKVERKEKQGERQPDDGKKFKKLDDTDYAVKQEFDEFFAASEAEVAKKASPSIFDMNATPEELAENEDMPVVQEMPPEVNKQSLSALFQGLGTKEKLETLQKQVATEKLPIVSEKPIEVETEAKFSSVFMPEQPDLTSVNPIAGFQVTSVEATKSVSAPIRTNIVDMQELVDKMVKQITIMNASGKTDTTIALKHPPLFAGANLTVTAFDTAKGQFNITFENLSQAAKNLIDMGENQNLLRNSLEQKGYMVHILVATTTTVENRQVVKDEQLGDRRDGEERQQGREDEREQS